MDASNSLKGSSAKKALTATTHCSKRSLFASEINFYYKLFIVIESKNIFKTQTYESI